MEDTDKNPDSLREFLSKHDVELLSGVPAIVSRFVNLLYPKMYKYFIRKFKVEHAVSEDLAQEVALKFWKIISNPKNKPDRLEMGYIYRVADSVIIDHFRRERHQEQQMSEGFEPVAEADPEISLIESLDVKEDFSDDEQLRCLDALYSLNERYRVILHLRYGKGKSIEEIADAQNISIENARLLHWRAIKSVKKLLKDKGP